jgi:hypothetical protein
VTTNCDIEDVDVSASTVGEEQMWTPEARSVPTGIVTLETKPAVHIVSVACAHSPCCSLPCVGCKYTPYHCDREGPRQPSAYSSPSSAPASEPSAPADQTGSKSPKTPATPPVK